MRRPVIDGAFPREAGAAPERPREPSDGDRRILESLDALAREAESSANGEFGPAIAALRRFAGYTRRRLAAELTRELGLPDESAARVKLYLADLENGLMSARRVATPVHDALAQLLRVEPAELIGAARFSKTLTRRDARAYARASRSSVTSRRGERPLPWDQVDALFLGRDEGEEGVAEARRR